MIGLGFVLGVAWAADPAVGPAVGPAVVPAVDPGAGAERPSAVRVRLDTDATWGIGSQMYLGALAHAEAQVPVWATPRADGTWDVGLRVAYGHEGMYFAPWIDPETFHGANHRVATQVVLGTTVHLAPQRRVSLGLHVLAGLNTVVYEGTLTYAAEDFTYSSRWSRHTFLASADVTLAVRASDKVGFNLAVTAPFPTDSSYVIGLVSVAMGPSFYLR